MAFRATLCWIQTSLTTRTSGEFQLKVESSSALLKLLLKFAIASRQNETIFNL
jgi:hypothetical protein